MDRGSSAGASGWLDADQRARLAAVADAVVPGSAGLGAVDYVDQLLGAFTTDPPRIWARETAASVGGDAAAVRWLPLGGWEELAWRTRIEGSRGDPSRTWNGPVVGLQERYQAGLAALGADVATLPAEDRLARLDADPAFARLVREHVAEALYADPAYGGNRAGGAWERIGFAGDVQPRGWRDDEVSDPAPLPAPGEAG